MPHFHCRKAVLLQVAVFVDAGYLYAQGSALLAGERRTRLRNRLGRDLTDDERMQYRTIFATLLRAAYND